MTRFRRRARWSLQCGKKFFSSGGDCQVSGRTAICNHHDGNRKKRTVASLRIASARGRSRQCPASHRSLKRKEPNHAAGNAINRLSVNCSWISFHRLPPRAPRIATSLLLAALRATRRLETFRQAISSMQPTAPISTSSGVFASSTTSSIIGRKTTLPLPVCPGFACGFDIAVRSPLSPLLPGPCPAFQARDDTNSGDCRAGNSSSA